MMESDIESFVCYGATDDVTKKLLDRVYFSPCQTHCRFQPSQRFDHDDYDWAH